MKSKGFELTNLLEKVNTFLERSIVVFGDQAWNLDMKTSENCWFQWNHLTDLILWVLLIYQQRWQNSLAWIFKVKDRLNMEEFWKRAKTLNYLEKNPKITCKNEILGSLVKWKKKINIKIEKPLYQWNYRGSRWFICFKKSALIKYYSTSSSLLS